MKSVQVHCTPPAGGKIALSFPPGHLLAHGGNTYAAAKSSYDVDEIGSIAFRLHGHDISTAVRDFSIQAIRQDSGASDTAKYTVFSFDISCGGSIATDRTIDAIVGEKTTLDAVVSPPDTPRDAVKWTIPSKIVKSYTQEVELGKVTHLNDSDLAKDAVAFHWIDGGMKDVSASAAVGGNKCTASANFNVKRPMATLTSQLTAVNPRVGIRNMVDRNGVVQLEMVLGSQYSDGITWTAQVTTPDNGAGKVAFLQLINSDQTFVAKNASDTRTLKSLQSFVLDSSNGSSAFYDAAISLGNSDTKQCFSGDTPSIQLDVNDNYLINTIGMSLISYTRLDNFKLFLMYKPDKSDSIWVTLRMFEWSWGGACAKNLTTGIWSMLSNSTSAKNYASVGSTTLPEWDMSFPSLPYQ